MKIDDNLLVSIAQFIDYLSTPHNAFGVWIAATGMIAGAYFLGPIAAAL